MKLGILAGVLNEKFWTNKKVFYFCLASILITWLPPVLLSFLDGVFFSDDHKNGMQNAYLFHLRFLLIVPLFLLSELYATKIVLDKVHSIEFSNLIDDADKVKLDECIKKVSRLANSYWLHFVLLLFIIGYRLYETQEHHILCKTWLVKDCSSNPIKWTLAGLWATWISNVIFLFILIRNFWLIVVWTYFVRKISLLPLKLSAIHPDKFGGVGFLCDLPLPFIFTTIAFSITVTSGIASRMLLINKELESFYPVMFALGSLVIFIHVIPLLSLTPSLIQCKVNQRKKYSALVLLHHSNFYKKWIEGKGGNHEILGNPDPSSAADSNTYFEAVIKMKIIPVNIKALVVVFITSMSPLLVVFLIKYPVKQIFEYLFKMIFNSGVV